MFNRSKIWAGGLLAAAFIAGLGVGVGSQAALADDRPARRERPSYVDRLTRELSLTDAQRDTVSTILQQSETRMHELWSEVRPRMAAVREEIRAEVMGTLTADQQALYRGMISRWDSVRAAREAGHAR